MRSLRTARYRVSVELVFDFVFYCKDFLRPILLDHLNIMQALLNQSGLQLTVLNTILTGLELFAFTES